MTHERSRVVLVGGMGAGKTCVGRALAARWGWTFRDSDAEVERRTGCSVRALFAQNGEVAFRAQEESVLREWATDGATRCVMALGGGAPTLAAYEALASTATVVWLRASAAAALARLTREDVAERPMLDAPDAGAALAALLRARDAAYARRAAFTLDTDDRTVDDAVDAIDRWWNGGAS